MERNQYLVDLMKEKGLSKTFVADKLGISRRYLYLKINGDYDFTASEINTLSELLGITSGAEIKRIFLTKRCTE